MWNPTTDLDCLYKADVLMNEFGKDEDVGMCLVDVHAVAVFLHVGQLSKGTRQRRVLFRTAEHCYAICQQAGTLRQL